MSEQGVLWSSGDHRWHLRVMEVTKSHGKRVSHILWSPRQPQPQRLIRWETRKSDIGAQVPILKCLHWLMDDWGPYWPSVPGSNLLSDVHWYPRYWSPHNWPQQWSRKCPGQASRTRTLVKLRPGSGDRTSGGCWNENWPRLCSVRVIFLDHCWGQVCNTQASCQSIY